MKLFVIGFLSLAVTVPAFADTCGFQVKIDKIKLKHHSAGTNPRNQLIIQAWSDSTGDFSVSLRHVETIHKDFLDETVTLLSKPEAGTLIDSCRKDGFAKKLPKGLKIRITQVNDRQKILLDETLNVETSSNEGELPYILKNENIEVKYRLARVMQFDHI